MHTILVANPKGGSGKTTLATNVAGWLAGKRQRVVLADHDPQRSATEWLARRPPLFPPIIGLRRGREEGRPARLRPGVRRRRQPRRTARRRPAPTRCARADLMLVPVSPSAFDMAATRHFLAAVARHKPVRRGTLAVGLVAMRVDARTVSAGELDAFLGELGHPLVAHLRDTQVYVHCARDGAIGLRPAALARRARTGSSGGR